MTAVVEGIETAEQQDLVAHRGSTCYGQGSHLARPMAPDRFPEVLRAL